MQEPHERAVRPPNRRRPPYQLAGNTLLLIKWGGYFLFLLAVSFAHIARPPTVTVYHIVMGISLSREWNGALLSLSWGFLWLTILVGGFGLMINATRLRRKGDRLSVGLIVLLLMTLMAMARLPVRSPFDYFSALVG
ncbi:MAG: hypothetical protein HQM00_06180 [Magnetococcales bacterium]|nr:hypothetical protein [Magnetococcales bacterium]